MKKTKILAVLGILLAMGITACQPAQDSSKAGGDQSQGGEASQPAGDSEHKHVYGEWVQTVAPTCTEKGKEEQVCECGDKKERDVKALGHDWGEWTPKTAASCTEDGKDERTCKVCGAKEERDVKAAHDWDAESTVAAGTDPADQVGYTLASCKKGDAIKADIKAVDAKFYKGGIKSGTPSGYFKLNSKNDKAYWKFTVAGTKMYKGMLYQRGAMDSFSTNTTKSYASTSTSGDNAPEYTRGNFEVKVNGDALDKTEWIRIPFEELLAEGDDSSAMGDNYSPLAMCPIGECVIQPGLNEITYERLGSYNLIISDLIFIGAEFEHTHQAATTWSSDDEQHWHACEALGCPTGKLDVANHTFGDWEENKAATCKEAGERQHTCTVCGKVVKEEIAKLAHTIGEPYDVVPATCQAAGSQKKKCSVCEEVVEEVLPKADHNFGDAIVNNAAGDGYIATTGHNCSVCEKGALRWSALDYDQTASSSGLDIQSTYVSFGSGTVENKGGTEGAGSHIIYKVNVAAAQEKAGLAFKIKNTGGNSGNADVFGPVPNDSSLGYIKQADGTLVASTHRYGLRVNGVEYFLGDNNYGDQANVTGWFEWPVEFPLQAGVNTIDVFPYQGYRAQLMEFELTGLPKFVSTHTHNGADTWVSDDNSHWHACTGAGCPIADGIYDKADHTWGEVVVKTAATHSAAGVGEKECTICHKKVEVTIPKVAHEWVDGTPVANTDSKNVIPMTCACGKVGAKMSENDYSSGEFGSGDDAADALRPSQGKAIVYKIIVSKAGNYSLEFGMFCKSNDSVAMSQRGFSVKVNDAAATVTIDGTTTPKALGMTATNAVQIELCASIPLNAGENTIAITCASYRLHYKGNLVVAEL